ncbi:MAG: DUF86 domain-containing protein [Oscillospiraceae bacterium]|nr:DUF86 domain-containing protein [Oscillospiraceae bacterium]
MNERDRNHIERVKNELEFIRKSLQNIDKKAFLSDDVIQHAISMALISIGESARNLSDNFKESNPHIEWVQIVAVRNIAAHGYWQLDMEQIWQAIDEDIPELERFFNSLEN